MSLYNDLTAVLTPYANKIKRNESDIGDIKSVVVNGLDEYSVRWSRESIGSADGIALSNSTRICTKNPIDENIIYVSCEAGSKYAVYVYDGTTYLGIWDGSTIAKRVAWQTSPLLLSPIRQYNIKILLAKSDDSTIYESYSSNMHLLGSIDTDKVMETKTELTSSDNLDNTKTIGVYQTLSVSLPTGTLPTTKGGVVNVFKANDLCVQQYVTSTEQYVRLMSSNGTWNNWIELANAGTAFGFKGTLTNEDDLNSVTASGLYNYSNNSKPGSAPDINAGGILAVYGINTTLIEQVFYCNYGGLNYTARRIKTSIGWTNWLIDNVTGLMSRGLLTSSDDLDDIENNGVYYFNTTSLPTNHPDVTGGGAVCNFTTNHVCVQYYVTASKQFYRFKTVSGTWGSWIELADENEVSKRFDAIKYPAILNISGNGSTKIQKEIKLVSGNSYRVDVLNPVWNHTATASGLSIFWLRSSDGTHKVFDYLGSAERVNTPTIFTARTTDYILDVRADVNESVFVCFTDITSSGSGGTEYADNAHLNVFKYTHQLGLLKWTPKSTVMTGEGERPANEEVTGAPYSSVKEYHKYIGADVSIHTFMTAVNDPHSLFYTEYVNENGSQSAYGRTYHGTNATCYFGSVCSALVSLAIGKKSQIASWEYQTIKEEFEILQNQSVLALDVGDILSYNGHCCVITKINRNGNGSIETIEMDEHAAPVVMKTYAPSVLEDRAGFHNGAWCRYKFLDMNTDYKPSPFVLLEGESVYNRGDFVFIDGISSRTYYRSINSNSDSTFTATNWMQISVYIPGTEYKRDFDNPVFVSLGDHLYKCITTHTAGVEFDPSKWEEIKGVFEWAAYPYVYNDDICTFAGDRASFRTGDLIYIDYAKGSYTSMQLYKDGTLLQTIPLPGSGYQINVSSYCAGAGLYKARLTDGTNYSRYTYFEVIDTTVTATYSNGFATINFSSVNGRPIDIQIPEINGRYTCHVTPTEDEIAKGQIIICPKARMYAETFIYPDRYEGFSKTVYARVIFEGEYGNAANDKIELGVLEAEVGDIVYPNVPKDLGTITGNKSVILDGRMTENRYSFSFVAGSSASLTVYPAIGSIVWKNALPVSLTNETTYLVSVENGIGNVVSVT